MEAKRLASFHQRERVRSGERENDRLYLPDSLGRTFTFQVLEHLHFLYETDIYLERDPQAPGSL